MRVAIHEVVDKADDVIFRCTLNGSAADRWLEVPAWMFDRTRCLDPPRLTASPFVSMDALSALSDLLLQALKKPPRSSSNAPHFSASRSSHDQNRGEAHDHAKPGTTASDASRAAKASAMVNQHTKRQGNRAPVRQQKAPQGISALVEAPTATDNVPIQTAVAATPAAAKAPGANPAPIKKKATKKPYVTLRYASRSELLGLGPGQYYMSGSSDEYYARGGRGEHYRDRGRWGGRRYQDWQ